MATLINNAGVQHYVNKMILAENRKVGSKGLPTALNDIDNLIDEMKTHFEAEYGSALDMKLSNNENIFNVGTGTDVDKRSEVENSFTDVELSGNSLVNLCPQKYKFVTVTTKGEATLDGLDVTYDSPTYRIKAFTLTQSLKPNTTYTAIVNVLSLINTNTIDSYVKYSDGETLYGQFSATQLGLNIKKFTTTNKIATELAYYLNSGERSGKISGVIILEGDWTNKPIPQHFEGLKSIGEKEDGSHKISISSVGKNLFKIDSKIEPSTGNTRIELANDSFKLIFDGENPASWITSQKTIQLKPNTSYVFSCKSSNIVDNVLVGIKKGDGSHLTDFTKSLSYVRFTSPLDGIVNFRFFLNNATAMGKNSVATFTEVILEENTKLTTYESHKEDKKEISLNEPLRSLPNGVKDAIEKVNGEWKIVRRCVQIDLNGTEYWTHKNPSQEDGVNTALFSTNDILNAKDFPKLCDRFIPKNSNLMLNSHPDSEGIGCWSAKKNVNIRINKNRLSTVDSDGFKEWLSQNPTKVIYELATPIIEDISPVTLQCWKNGTISIDEVLPVESTHTVALNKPAQIQRNIEELTTLRKRVKKLEEMYDDIALEQAYKLSLINFNFELDYN